MTLLQKQRLEKRRSELYHAEVKKEFKNGYWHYTYLKKNTGNKKYTYKSLKEVEDEKRKKETEGMGMIDKLKYKYNSAKDSINRKLSLAKVLYEARTSETKRKFDEARKYLESTHTPEMKRLSESMRLNGKTVKRYQSNAKDLQDDVSILREKERRLREELNVAKKERNNKSKSGNFLNDLNNSLEKNKKFRELNANYTDVRSKLTYKEDRLKDVKGRLSDKKKELESDTKLYNSKNSNAKYASTLGRYSKDANGRYKTGR